MQGRVPKRMIAVACVSAVAMWGLSLTHVNAQSHQAQGQQQDQKVKQDKKAKQEKKAKQDKQDQQAKQKQQQADQQLARKDQQAQQKQQQADQQLARREQLALQKRQQVQDQAQRYARQQKPLPVQERRQRITAHEQRVVLYRSYLDQQRLAAQQRSVELRKQNRQAQYAFQERYMRLMREQQQGVQFQSGYDYDSDPYFYTPSNYRYSRDGRYFQTNQYGFDLLNQAVQYGYDEGMHAGRADRQDNWSYSYRDSYAYQDANYGYGGFYVDRDDYNIYFREGFRRGYEDGYYSRYRYGRDINGRATILGNELSMILPFDFLR